VSDSSLGLVIFAVSHTIKTNGKSGGRGYTFLCGIDAALDCSKDLFYFCFVFVARQMALRKSLIYTKNTRAKSERMNLSLAGQTRYPTDTIKGQK